MLKVIITGAYSTGKTSLANRLQADLLLKGRSVAFVSDTARTCPLPLNKNQTDETSLWLIATQVSREIVEQAGNAELLICDRGVPDILAHNEDMRSTSISSRVTLLKPFLADWLKTYDVILLSRVDSAIPIEPDGLRVIDPAYRENLDRLAVRVLTSIPNVYELPFGDKERLAYAREVVERRFSSLFRRSCSST
ncbi:ATP-binding protein [Bosea vestrisii]|uniref:ATP-binding protein n=1 Tax=Bosea vestrisii TaxID=151416 RepID=A0ABW0HJQ0_9HYPH